MAPPASDRSRITIPLALLGVAALAAAVVASLGAGGIVGRAGSGQAAAERPSVTVIATASAGTGTGGIVSAASPPGKPGYHLTFHDEFSGKRLDSGRWNTRMAWGAATRKELQVYAPSAVSVGDGALTITASKRGGQLVSGAVTTYDSYQFRYGYAEARMKIPAGTGLWSAFWLLTRVHGPNDEIDILEALGQTPKLGYNVLHYGTAKKKQIQLTTFSGPDLSDDYHVYAVDWEPDHLAWYVDGVEVHRESSYVPKVPMYVIANLAVGGDGSWSGPPDAYTKFPAPLAIDYIRVYQRD